MKAHIFLIANPKFQLQILCTVLDPITKSVKLNGIPENNFLCIFIIASSPGVHTFFCLLESKQEATSGWNFTKCIFRGQGQSIKSETYVMLEWAYPPLRSWGPDSGRWGRFMKAVKLSHPGHAWDFAWYRGQRPSPARVIKMSHNNNSRTRKCGGFVT